MIALRTSIAVAASIAALAAPAALADSTPVGPLPPGATTNWTTSRGSYIAITVVRRRLSTGLVWRIARPVNPAVIQQVGEADVGPTVVLVFQAVGRGNATVALALTKGDASAKAVESSIHRIKVN